MEETRLNNCLDNLLIDYNNSRKYSSFVTEPLMSDHKALVIEVNKSSQDKSTCQKNSETENMPFRYISEAGKFQCYTYLEATDWSFLSENLLTADQ